MKKEGSFCFFQNVIRSNKVSPLFQARFNKHIKIQVKNMALIENNEFNIQNIIRNIVSFLFRFSGTLIMKEFIIRLILGYLSRNV